MSNRREDRRVFISRIALFSLIQLGLGLLVVARLAYLQIYQSSKYTLLSDRNRIVTKQTLPCRGRILDAAGRVLATNQRTYSVVLDLCEISKEKRSETISYLIANHDLKDDVINRLNNLPSIVTNINRYILLQDDLSWRELSQYYITSSKIPGIVIERNATRQYSYSESCSHIIGYTGAPTYDDLANSDNRALSVPTARIGKTCIEKQYNEELFGKSGIKHIEVNSRRQFVRNINEIDAVPGKDIELTINLDLQLEVYQLLTQHESASCVVIDVDTGAVLAMVSYPGYDINIFKRRIAKEELQQIYENPYNPMINKVISGQYPPGSVFKMITALAALKKGIIDENTRFNCTGCYNLGEHKFHCWKWKSGGHGLINLEDAIAKSCDVYFYNVAKMLSPNEIAEVARDFGLGAITGIDMPNEKPGLVPTKSWKKSKKHRTWTTGDTLNMAIGQGFVLATPLQLAQMMAMLVNGQKRITPHLNKACKQRDFSHLKYDPKHIQLIFDGMNAVVNTWYGTAHHSAIDDDNFMFGGKTGSSQVFNITEKQRRAGKTVSDDYCKKEHAVFVGYAPVDNPKVVVSVFVEHGGGGAQTAAPLARDVLIATKQYMPELFK